MGTNYYWTPEHDICPACHRTDPTPPKLHIGKSSAGWTFNFATPRTEPHLTSWKTWRLHIATRSGTITDEYGCTITLADMITIVDARTPNLKRIYDVATHRERQEGIYWLDNEGQSFTNREFS